MYFFQRANKQIGTYPVPSGQSPNPVFSPNILALRNTYTKSPCSNSSRIMGRGNPIIGNTPPYFTSGQLLQMALMQDNGLFPQCFKAVFSLPAHSPWSWTCLLDGSMRLINYGDSAGDLVNQFITWNMSTYSPPGLINRAAVPSAVCNWLQLNVDAGSPPPIFFDISSGPPYYSSSPTGYTIDFGTLDFAGNPCWTVVNGGVTWYGPETSNVLTGFFTTYTGVNTATAYRSADQNILGGSPVGNILAQGYGTALSLTLSSPVTVQGTPEQVIGTITLNYSGSEGSGYGPTETWATSWTSRPTFTELANSTYTYTGSVPILDSSSVTLTQVI